VVQIVVMERLKWIRTVAFVLLLSLLHFNHSLDAEEWPSEVSANRKRNLGVHDGAKSPKSESACAKETSRATAELARLVGSPSFRGRAED
jgi:hypothetical protein